MKKDTWALTKFLGKTESSHFSKANFSVEPTQVEFCVHEAGSDTLSVSRNGSYWFTLEHPRITINNTGIIVEGFIEVGYYRGIPRYEKVVFEARKGNYRTKTI